MVHALINKFHDFKNGLVTRLIYKNIEKLRWFEKCLKMLKKRNVTVNGKMYLNAYPLNGQSP